MSKVISASEAVNLIEDNDTLAVSGFGLAGVAEELLIALEERYATESHPQGLQCTQVRLVTVTKRG